MIDHGSGNGRKYPRYSPAGRNDALIYARISYPMQLTFRLRPTRTVLGVWRQMHSASNPASRIARSSLSRGK